MIWTKFLTCIVILAGAPLLAQDVQHNHSGLPGGEQGARQSRQANAGPHNGVLQTVEGLQLETVIAADGIRVYAYNANGDPLDARGARGVAVLRIESDAKRYRYDLFPDAPQDGAASPLTVAVDLRRIAGATVDVELNLVGLPGAPRQPIRAVARTTVPMTEKQRVAAAIASQKVCPVSGQPLGSMGDPIAVAVGDQEVYVCCQACVAAVRANPTKYLTQVSGAAGAVPPGGDAVRPGVFKVTAADQPYIAAQGACPVMDEPLDGMGGPYKVHADGKAIYICCPGCAKKVAADPTKYLNVLAQQGVTPPVLKTPHAAPPAAADQVRPGVFKVTAADQPLIAAQQLCPVMDEPLDGMGGPYRVDIDGRAVYICCPGCAKKLQANPQVYLQKLTANGVESPAVK